MNERSPPRRVVQRPGPCETIPEPEGWPIVSLDKITPVLLTLDEAPNIGRTLSTLAWARRVVVVDSGSTDQTSQIAASFRNTAWFERPFDDYGRQWSYAVRETAIDTPFVLALDADMPVPVVLRDELALLVEREALAGAIVAFQYCIGGHPLLGSVYPPQLRLLRAGAAAFGQVGHKHLFRVQGPVAHCRSRLVHDDRKPLERFMASQLRYSTLEAERLTSSRRRDLKTSLRLHLPGWPALVALLAYVRAGGPLCGPAARRYALERLLFEAALRCRLVDRVLEAQRPARA